MNAYTLHRFPPDIISYAVWLYYRFNLSHRVIEDPLAERGISVSNSYTHRLQSMSQHHIRCRSFIKPSRTPRADNVLNPVQEGVYPRGKLETADHPVVLGLPDAEGVLVAEVGGVGLGKGFRDNTARIAMPDNEPPAYPDLTRIGRIPRNPA